MIVQTIVPFILNNLNYFQASGVDLPPREQRGHHPVCPTSRGHQQRPQPVRRSLRRVLKVGLHNV